MAWINDSGSKTSRSGHWVRPLGQVGGSETSDFGLVGSLGQRSTGQVILLGHRLLGQVTGSDIWVELDDWVKDFLGRVGSLGHNASDRAVGGQG